MKYEAERNSMIQAALTMLQYRLIALAGGNVALRMPCGNFLVTPSAMAYETMKPEDIVLVDRDGNTVEGARRPSSDMKALLYIFNHKPEVGAVIHTHQPYATAVGLVEDELPGCLVTILDACRTCATTGSSPSAVIWTKPFTAPSIWRNPRKPTWPPAP